MTAPNGTPDPRRGRPARWLLTLLAAGLAAALVLSAWDRGGRGRHALVKWRPSVEALHRGEPVYHLQGRGIQAEGREPEGYPTPPITALALTPFLALGNRPGSALFALAQIAAALYLFRTAQSLAARAGGFATWQTALLVAGSFRLVLSDIQHGNTNLFVAAAVAATARNHLHHRPASAGMWLGLATALKITPALGLLLFAIEGRWRSLLATLLTLGLLLFAVPAVCLGWKANLEHLESYAHQMLVPFLRGDPPGWMQVEHINQSALGTLARLTTETIAIEARGDLWLEPVSVHLLRLDPRDFGLLLCCVQAAVLFALCWTIWRVRKDPRTAVRMAAFGALCCAMLLLSERSWKHHHVLAILPLAVCVAALDDPLRSVRRWARFAVGFALLGFGLSGSFPLGARGSDLAEAYGIFTAATVVLLGTCVSIAARTTAGPSGSASNDGAYREQREST